MKNQDENLLKDPDTRKGVQLVSRFTKRLS